MTKQDMFTAYHNDILFFLLEKTNDRNVAKDILQSTFLKALENYDTLKDKHKVKSWLFQISRNELANYYNEEKSYATEIDLNTIHSNKTNLSFSNQFCCFDKFVNELPTIYKQPIILVYKEGKKQKEVAKILHLKLTTVKARIRRAKKILVTNFSECCHYGIDDNGKLVGEQNCVSCDKINLITNSDE